MQDKEIKDAMCSSNKKNASVDAALEDEYYTIYYNVSADVIDKDTPTTVAKAKFNTINEQWTYYIKTGQGFLYDPMNTKDAHYSRLQEIATWKYKRTTHKAFRHYMKFLKTRNRLHYRRAEREVNNG